MPRLHGSRFSARQRLIDASLGLEKPSPCERPVPMEYHGHPDQIRVGFGMEPPTKLIADFQLRCRKCEGCLRYRQRLWTARALTECALATRTWFGTLTIRPEDRTRLLYSADLAFSKARCEPWSGGNEADQFRYLVDAASPDITNFLKRVRKNSDASLWETVLMCFGHY